jgi:hypothetical protein
LGAIQKECPWHRSGRQTCSYLSQRSCHLGSVSKRNKWIL